MATSYDVSLTRRWPVNQAYQWWSYQELGTDPSVLEGTSEVGGGGRDIRGRRGGEGTSEVGGGRREHQR